MSKKKEIKYPDFSIELPPAPLAESELNTRLANELTEWKLIESPLPHNPNHTKRELYRAFSFESFDHVVDFLQEIKEVCNILPHHPRLENLWATLDVYLSTWSIGHNISFKDIQLAKNLDRIYEEKFATDPPEKEEEIAGNKTFFQELITYIESDDLDTVLEKIDKFYLLNAEKEKPRDFILTKARFASYRNDFHRGTLSTETAKIERNVLRDSLLSFVSDLLQEDPEA